jgi:glucose-1-phosphate thymidylyltransferase
MCSKELIPVGEVEGPAGARPKAISEYLIEAMVGAGAQRICMVIAPDKHDLVRFYGSGAAHRVPIGYICQESPTGMADAIDQAYPWLRDTTVLMGMPDTIVNPPDTLSRLRAFAERERADIALAIARTDEPGRLGPVLFEPDGVVIEIFDKPEVAPHDLVWTVACWSPAFTEYLHLHSSRRSSTADEAPLGLIFQAALQDGLRVRALPFAGGLYVDAGTMEGLRAARRLADAPTLVPGP